MAMSKLAISGPSPSLLVLQVSEQRGLSNCSFESVCDSCPLKGKGFVTALHAHETGLQDGVRVLHGLIFCLAGLHSMNQ